MSTLSINRRLTSTAALPSAAGQEARPHAPVDAMDVAEAALLANPARNAAPLQRPRARGKLQAAAHALQPFVPALAGAAALTYLAARAHATFVPCCDPEDAYNPTNLYFSAENGTIQGVVSAPWDGWARYGKTWDVWATAAELAYNFFDVLVAQCGVQSQPTNGITGTGLNVPAYIAPNWWVQTFVNQYNVSDALSTTVKCIFDTGNAAP